MKNIIQYLLFLSSLLPHTSICSCIDNGNIFPPLLIVRIPLSGYVNFTWRVCVYKSRIKFYCPSWPRVTLMKLTLSATGELYQGISGSNPVGTEAALVFAEEFARPNPRCSKSSQETRDILNMQRFAWEHMKIQSGSHPYHANSPNGSWLICMWKSHVSPHLWLSEWPDKLIPEDTNLEPPNGSVILQWIRQVLNEVRGSSYPKRTYFRVHTFLDLPTLLVPKGGGRPY